MTTATVGVTILNGSGTPITVAAEQTGLMFSLHHTIEYGGALLSLANALPMAISVNGAAVSSAAPLPTVTAGSTGLDFSTTPAAIPLAGYALLQTIPANPSRAFVEIQNQGTGQVQVVRDTGGGQQLTTIMLAGAAIPGGQGGGWSSATFKGRIRIYAATSTAQIAAYQD